MPSTAVASAGDTKNDAIVSRRPHAGLGCSRRRLRYQLDLSIVGISTRGQLERTMLKEGTRMKRNAKDYSVAGGVGSWWGLGRGERPAKKRCEGTDLLTPFY